MKLTYWNDRKGHFDWHCENNEIADKLAAYEDAEEQGRLVRLPCKNGVKLYRVFNGNIEEYTVVSVSVHNHVKLRYVVECMPFIRFNWEDDFGRTVFLTREEAEAMMKGAER